MSFGCRLLAAIAMAALLAGSPALAFDTPLSEEAIREAYFLGQRRDDTLAHFLDKYTWYLAAPKSGPKIASVTFFTPYALVAQESSQRSAGYSAQQAQIDHRGRAESVRIIVQILLTDSYGAFTAVPTGSRSGAAVGYVPRPYDFWKDFDVRVFNSSAEDAQPLRPFSSRGEPNVSCSEEGGCSLIGATLYFDFAAERFERGDAFIDIVPPEGEPVSLDLDLAGLR